MPGMIDPRDNIRTTQNLTMQQQVNNRELEERKKKERAAKERSKKLTGMLGKLKSILNKSLNNAQQASINAAGNGMDSAGDTAKSASAGDVAKSK